jgi:hypothetical protein
LEPDVLTGIPTFLEVGSVEGGPANDYDYVDADPLNDLDLGERRAVP